jgi:hypothetical protein
MTFEEHPDSNEEISYNSRMKKNSGNVNIL